jgi:hypothetical protein
LFTQDQISELQSLYRKPGYPVDRVPTPRIEVRLKPLLSVRDQTERWDLAQKWCRAEVNHRAGHLWFRRIDKGVNHEQDPVPVFTFSDPGEAAKFIAKFL